MVQGESFLSQSHNGKEVTAAEPRMMTCCVGNNRCSGIQSSRQLTLARPTTFPPHQSSLQPFSHLALYNSLIPASKSTTGSNSRREDIVVM